MTPIEGGGKEGGGKERGGKEGGGKERGGKEGGKEGWREDGERKEGTRKTITNVITCWNFAGTELELESGYAGTIVHYLSGLYWYK